MFCYVSTKAKKIWRLCTVQLVVNYKEDKKTTPEEMSTWCEFLFEAEVGYDIILDHSWSNFKDIDLVQTQGDID